MRKRYGSHFGIYKDHNKRFKISISEIVLKKLRVKEMKIAILIGFQYEDTICLENKLNTLLNRKDHLGTLRGTMVDLYLAYNFCLKMNADRIAVITDIEENGNYLAAINEGIVDSHINNFLVQLKKLDQYNKYENKEHLVQLFQEIVMNGDELFLYYSGHAAKGSLILPNIEYLGIVELKKIVIQFMCNAGEIFVIMDCCQGIGFGLPYRLMKIEPVKYKNTEKDNEKDYCDIKETQKIVCISSTLISEDSITTQLGSIFSQIIFNLLDTQITSLPQLFKLISDHLNIVSHIQTATIYTSDPTITRLWPWLFKSNEICKYLYHC